MLFYGMKENSDVMPVITDPSHRRSATKLMRVKLLPEFIALHRNTGTDAI